MSKVTAELKLAAQVRAARGLLGWSQQELATKAGISRSAVARIEAGTVDPRSSTLRVLEEIFRAKNIKLLDEKGGYGAIIVMDRKYLERPNAQLSLDDI